MRIGVGEDAHALVEGRTLGICGLTVPYDRGLQGYSDGDVATHAIIDALLVDLLLPFSDKELLGIDFFSDDDGIL